MRSSARNIAAPYQQTAKPQVSLTPPKDGVGVGDKQLFPHLQGKEQVVDYRSFQFQQLEPTQNVMFDKYCGPTPESNWVVPGKLLVGAYPASNDDGETLELITSILKWGITKFVCLQQEYREHGVTEQMWRSGQALRPYFEDVRCIVRKKVLLPCLRNYPVVDEQNLSFVHFPIRDCGITDDDRVLELARTLVKNIAEGEIIYLHCWGGHGRTGTLVCIMLHLMYGYSDTQAMEYCQAVHDLRQCPVVVGSPQTQTQRDQVSRVIQKLMTQSRFRSRTMSGDGTMLRGAEAGEGVAVPAQQTLQSTLVSPRAAMSSSGNHSVGTATPETDHVAPECAMEAVPQGDSALPPPDDETSAEEADVSEPVAEKQKAGAEVAEPSNLIFAVPTNTSAGTSALSTPKDASPEMLVDGASDRMSISMTVDRSGGEEGIEGRMRLGTMDDNDLEGEEIAIQLGGDDVNVDVLQLQNELSDDTEQDDGGIEVRQAEGASLEPVDSTSIHPPKQVKPSFKFNRKGIATNQ